MTFYTINYLAQQNYWLDYVWLGLIVMALGAIILFGIKYWRQRWRVRYRDFTIFLALFLLFAAGVVYDKFQQKNVTYQQNSEVIPFLQQVAADYHVKQSQVALNSFQLTTNSIVKIKQKFYVVTLNDSTTNAYTLTPTSFYDANVVVK